MDYEISYKTFFVRFNWLCSWCWLQKNWKFNQFLFLPTMWVPSYGEHALLYAEDVTIIICFCNNLSSLMIFLFMTYIVAYVTGYSWFEKIQKSLTIVCPMVSCWYLVIFIVLFLGRKNILSTFDIWWWKDSFTETYWHTIGGYSKNLSKISFNAWSSLKNFLQQNLRNQFMSVTPISVASMQTIDLWCII